MKASTLLLFFLFTVNVFASVKASYNILEGKLHKGGSAYTEVIPNSQKFAVRMGYEIKKKPLVPVPSEYLKGEEIIDLPLMFQDERGYLELEAKGEIRIENGVIKFVKRTTAGKIKDAYEVLVLPKNGRSKIEIVYHPELPSVGWSKMKVIFISKIPLLDNYQIQMVIK